MNEPRETQDTVSLVDAMSTRRVFKNDFTTALGKVLAQQKT